MTPTEVTLAAGVVVTMLSSVFVPMYLSRVKADADGAQGELMSFEAFNKAIVKERDDLRAIVEKTKADAARTAVQVADQHSRDIAQVKAEYDEKLARANAKIADLEAQVDTLYRRLYQPGST